MTGSSDSKTSPNSLDAVLGTRIRLRRTALNVTQTQLGEALGISFQQIQKYERGQNRVSFSRLAGIAHVLDCRVADLIGGLDEDAPAAAFGMENASLTVEGAPELIAAYADLPTALRRALLKLLQELARSCRLQLSAAEPAPALRFRIPR